MTEPRRPLSPLELEQLALDEPGAPRHRLDDPAVAQQVEALRDENRTFVAGRDLRQDAAALARALSPAPPRPARRWRWALAPAALACAAAVWLALPLVTDPTGRPAVRTKGQSTLVAYHVTAGGQRAIGPDTVLGPGDEVRLGLTVDRAAHVVLVSVDGRRGLTVHLPRDGAGSVLYLPGPVERLHEAFVLDDAPGFERFFLVRRPEPFLVAPVIAQVSAWAERTPAPARDPLLLDGYDVTDLVVAKTGAGGPR